MDPHAAPAPTGTDPAAAAQPAQAGDAQILATVCALIETRQTVLPRRLVEPRPTPDELNTLLELAAAAPDHGQLTPRRFIAVPAAERHRLAEVFARPLERMFSMGAVPWGQLDPRVPHGHGPRAAPVRRATG